MMKIINLLSLNLIKVLSLMLSGRKAGQLGSALVVLVLMISGCGSPSKPGDQINLLGANYKPGDQEDPVELIAAETPETATTEAIETEQHAVEADNQLTSPPLSPKLSLEDKDKHGVGLLLPLSGANQALGYELLNAALMALTDYNSDNVSFWIEDTKGQAEVAARKMSNLGDQPVKIVVGPIFSTEALAVQPQLRHLTAFTLSNDTNLATSNMVVMGVSPDNRVRAIMQSPYAKGLSKLIVLAPVSAYGDILVREMQQLRPNQITVIRYSHESELNKIARHPVWSCQDYDGIVVGETGTRFHGLINALEQQHAVRRRARILAVGGWDYKTVRYLPEGTVFSIAYASEYKQFQTRYFQEFGVQPSALAAVMYDTVALVVYLLNQHPHNQVLDMSTLLSHRAYKGLNGVFAITSRGECERELLVMQRQRAKQLL